MSGSEREELPASVSTAPPPRRPARCSIAVASVVPGLLALYLWTASRSLRSPNPYSIGHWLQSYEHGFIKRGLLGSFVRPLLDGRGPEQINDTIELASFLLFAAFSLVMVASATMILWRDRSLAVLVAAVVVLGSPFVVFSAHLVGYFDPLVAALGITSVYLVARSRWLGAGLLSGFAILAHEMYAVVAMPMVALCSWLQLDAQIRWRPTLELLMAPTLALAAVMVSTLLNGDEVLAAIREDIAGRGVLEPYWVDMSTYHLEHGFLENLRREYRFGWARARNRMMAVVVLPALISLLVAGATQLYRSRRTRWIPVYVAFALSPWLMHWVAWDLHRIAILPIFTAFLGFFGFSLLLPAPTDRQALPRWCIAGIFALGLGAAAANAWTEVPLMDGQRDGEGAFSIGLSDDG